MRKLMCVLLAGFALSAQAFDCRDLAMFAASVALQRDSGHDRQAVVGATELLFGSESMLSEVARDAYDGKPVDPGQNAQLWYVACQMQAAQQPPTADPPSTSNPDVTG